MDSDDGLWGQILNDWLKQIAFDDKGGLNHAVSNPVLSSDQEGYTYINTLDNEIKRLNSDGASWTTLLKGIAPGTATGQMLWWDNTTNRWQNTETSELVWDDTNKRYGVGVSTPSVRLDVVGDAHLLPAPNTELADASFGDSQWSLHLDEVKDKFILKARKSTSTFFTRTLGVDLSPIANGTTVEEVDITLINSAGQIYCEICQAGGGDLTVQDNEKHWTLNCTTSSGTGGKARSNALTAGTATSPRVNYIYLKVVAGVVTFQSSITKPLGAFSWIAKTVVPDAVTFTTTGAYTLEDWTDPLSLQNTQGALSLEREKIRQLGATYSTGVNQSLTVTTNAGVPDNLVFNTTSGEVYQFLSKTFPAFAGSPTLYVVNDPIAEYSTITDLNQITVDSQNVSLSNRDYNLVVWGAINNKTSECKLFVNLPNDSYNNTTQCLQDVENTINSSIPAQFKGVGFLIARLAISHSTVSGGTYNLLTGSRVNLGIEDLRGVQPSTSGGGSGGGGGAPVRAIYHVSSNTVVTDTNGIYLVATSGSDITITMPDSTLSNDGSNIDIVKESGAENVIVTTLGGTQNIGSSTTQTIAQSSKGISVLSDYNGGASSNYEILSDSRFLEGDVEGALQYWDDTTKAWKTTQNQLRYLNNHLTVGDGTVTDQTLVEIDTGLAANNAQDYFASSYFGSYRGKLWQSKNPGDDAAMILESNTGKAEFMAVSQGATASGSHNDLIALNLASYEGSADIYDSAFADWVNFRNIEMSRYYNGIDLTWRLRLWDGAIWSSSMEYDETGLFKVPQIQINSTAVIDSILDEDDLGSDSGTALATQQSIKAYVDSRELIPETRMFDVYDSVGGQAFIDTPITVAVDTVRKSENLGAGYALSSGEVTIDETDTFVVIFRVSADISTGTGRTASRAYLERFSGGSWSEVVGFVGHMYNRTAGYGDNSCTVQGILDVMAGERFRIRAVRTIGSSTLETLPDSSGLTMFTVKTAGGSGTRPYISTISNFLLLQSITTDITVDGNFFDPDMIVYFGPEVTFNNFVSVSPTQFVASVTTSSNNQTPFTMSVKRGSLEHYGQDPTVEVTDVLKGTGVAGAFTTDFDGGGTGAVLWGASWDLAIFGTIDSIDGYFMSSVAGTTSAGTGPDANTMFGVGTNSYMYTENSGSNSGAGQYGTATTTNFAEITQIDFSYHMAGANHVKFSVLTQNGDDSWTERWSVTGAQHVNQTDAATPVTIDASAWNAKAVRFVFGEGANQWSSDVAIDNVVITSV